MNWNELMGSERERVTARVSLSRESYEAQPAAAKVVSSVHHITRYPIPTIIVDNILYPFLHPQLIFSYIVHPILHLPQHVRDEHQQQTPPRLGPYQHQILGGQRQRQDR